LNSRYKIIAATIKEGMMKIASSRVKRLTRLSRGGVAMLAPAGSLANVIQVYHQTGGHRF
jgi:hypothetical protein